MHPASATGHEVFIPLDVSATGLPDPGKNPSPFPPVGHSCIRVCAVLFHQERPASATRSHFHPHPLNCQRSKHSTPIWLFGAVLFALASLEYWEKKISLDTGNLKIFLEKESPSTSLWEYLYPFVSRVGMAKDFTCGDNLRHVQVYGSASAFWTTTFTAV